MMQKIERYIPYLLAALLLVLFAVQLQSVQEFVFYHREQQQILPWDCDQLFQRYHGVAGPSLFLAHFFTQFFFAKGAGAIITALLAVIAVFALWHVCKRLCGNIVLFPLCAVPLAFELSNLNDEYYTYQGFVCFVLLCVFMALHSWLAAKLSLYLRMACGAVLSIILLYLAGSVCLPFAIFVLVDDLLLRRDKWFFQLLTMAITALALFLAYRWCLLPTTLSAYSQDLYYSMLLPVPSGIKYSWLGLIALPFVAWAISKLKMPAKAGVRLTLGLAAFLCVGALVYGLGEKDRKNTNILLELQHDAIIEDWDGILNNPNAYSHNYLVMNYVNLALSKKHMLLTHFFRYPQNDVQNIMVARETTDTNVPLSFIFSFVTYQMGDMGAAQNHAHDVFECTTYGQPTMLQMLVKTNLTRGAYAVAEKYISLLEKTWRYSSWAKDMRRFLYNDAAVEADPELGLLRKDLPADDFTTSDTFESLIKTLQTNPEDTNARDYLIAYLFLYRDTEYTNRVVETFWNTPALNPFPTQLQEVFLLVNGEDIDYCRSRGVDEETVSRYIHFMNSLSQAERGRTNPAATLRKEFGNTIWYQFMFN